VLYTSGNFIVTTVTILKIFLIFLKRASKLTWVRRINMYKRQLSTVIWLYEIITITWSRWFITLTDDFNSSSFTNFFIRLEERWWRRRITKVKPILTRTIHHRAILSPSILLHMSVTTCPRDDTFLPSILSILST